MYNTMSEGKVLISDYLSKEVLSNRKLFFIWDEMMTDELVEMLDDYTKETGVQFEKEQHPGYWIFKKKDT